MDIPSSYIRQHSKACFILLILASIRGTVIETDYQRNGCARQAQKVALSGRTVDRYIIHSNLYRGYYLHFRIPDLRFFPRVFRPAARPANPFDCGVAAKLLI